MSANRTSFAALVFLGTLLLAKPASAQSLPDAPGKDTVIKLCTSCHDVSTILNANMSVNGWPGELQKMMGLGAQGTDQEFRAVLDYLAANCSTPVSRVTINSASAAEIELALQVSHKESLAIVQYREKNGAFKSPADLKKVPGVDAKRIDANKDRITF